MTDLWSLHIRGWELVLFSHPLEKKSTDGRVRTIGTDQYLAMIRLTITCADSDTLVGLLDCNHLFVERELFRGYKLEENVI